MFCYLDSNKLLVAKFLSSRSQFLVASQSYFSQPVTCTSSQVLVTNFISSSSQLLVASCSYYSYSVTSSQLLLQLNLPIFQNYHNFYNICRQNTGDPHQNMLLILISISVLILLVILLVFFKFRHVLWNRKRRTQNSRRGRLI